MTEKDLDAVLFEIDDDTYAVNKPYMQELIKLARLGLWARDVAHPALIYYECYMNQPELLKGGFQKYPSPKVAKDALDKYPKENA